MPASNSKLLRLLSHLAAGILISQTGGCFSDEPPAEATSSASQSSASTTTGMSTDASASSTSVGTETGGEGVCGAPDSFSYQTGDDCFCVLGYEWCSDDPTDFTCCSQTPGICDGPYNQQIAGQCLCVEGYTWCSDDPTDYSCCEESDTSDTGDTGTMCDLTPLPESCDPERELAYCTSTTQECLAESEYFICDASGVWVPEDGSLECILSDYDFSYGCIDESGRGTITQICGLGPGTPCDDVADTCSDEDMLRFCAYGKLGTLSCQTQCQNVGDSMGVLYDYGSCGAQDGAFKCLCCDFEDPGCGP